MILIVLIFHKKVHSTYAGGEQGERVIHVHENSAKNAGTYVLLERMGVIGGRRRRRGAP